MARPVVLGAMVLVALAGAAVAKPATTRDGTYAGATRQHLPLLLVVRHDAITHLHFKVRDSCGSVGDVHGGPGPSDGTIDPRGRFYIDFPGGLNALTIQGRVSAKTATGTIEVGNLGCKGINFAFHLRRIRNAR